MDCPALLEPVQSAALLRAHAIGLELLAAGLVKALSAETRKLGDQRIMQTDFFGILMVNIEMVEEVKSISEFKPMFPERKWMEYKRTHRPNLSLICYQAL
jgi:hypothetical protein